MDEAVKNQKTHDTPQSVSSVGTLNKEGEVRASVEVSETLPKIEQELSEFVKPSEPEVPEHPEVGIHRAAEATSVPVAPSGIVQLPSEEEAQKIIKTQSNVETDIKSHREGVYFLPSIVGLAVIKIKEILKSSFLQRSRA